MSLHPGNRIFRNISNYYSVSERTADVNSIGGVPQGKITKTFCCHYYVKNTDESHLSNLLSTISVFILFTEAAVHRFFLVALKNFPSY